MVDLTPFLPGLSRVQGKAAVARFDGRRLSSEGGVLALREIEAAGPSGGGSPALLHRHPSNQADSFKDGKSCSASPFFKIEARPFGQRVRFFAQVAAGAPYADPPMVMRAQICDLPREGWTTMQVHLKSRP